VQNDFTRNIAAIDGPNELPHRSVRGNTPGGPPGDRRVMTTDITHDGDIDPCEMLLHDRICEYPLAWV
jgi:hypothetical protein